MNCGFAAELSYLTNIRDRLEQLQHSGAFQSLIENLRRGDVLRDGIMRYLSDKLLDMRNRDVQGALGRGAPGHAMGHFGAGGAPLPPPRQQPPYAAGRVPPGHAARHEAAAAEWCWACGSTRCSGAFQGAQACRCSIRQRQVLPFLPDHERHPTRPGERGVYVPPRSLPGRPAQPTLRQVKDRWDELSPNIPYTGPQLGALGRQA